MPYMPLTIETLKKMKNDRDCILFYELISKKASEIGGNGNPELPKTKQKKLFFVAVFR